MPHNSSNINSIVVIVLIVIKITLVHRGSNSSSNNNIYRSSGNTNMSVDNTSFGPYELY